jgi:hypothetical protein
MGGATAAVTVAVMGAYQQPFAQNCTDPQSKPAKALESYPYPSRYRPLSAYSEVQQDGTGCTECGCCGRRTRLKAAVAQLRPFGSGCILHFLQ